MMTYVTNIFLSTRTHLEIYHGDNFAIRHRWKAHTSEDSRWIVGI